MIIKMKPKKKLRWSSHQPVIHSMLELISPKIIVELGIGHFSSPLFINSTAEKLFHIENDIEWFNSIKNHYIFDNRSELIYHNLEGDINKSTKKSELSLSKIKDIHAFYENFNETIRNINKEPKLLFVDQYTCLRTTSINMLGDSFEAIIYHDLETPETYEYEKISKDFENTYDHYALKIDNSTWTGFFIKKNTINESLLTSVIEKHSKEFAKNFDVPSSRFKLEKM